MKRDTRMPQLTLCFVQQEDKVLLGMKKVRFGAGYLNGFGGKVEKNESIEEGACRELKEECGLTTTPQNLTKVAVIRFHFNDKPEFDQEVHVFLVKKWSGTPHDSDEMAVAWYSLTDTATFDAMWPSDKYWVPMVVMEGKKIKGTVYFSGKEKPFTVQNFEFKETSFT